MHPRLDSFVSGGNVYNAKLLECAGRSAFALHSFAWHGVPPRGAWDLLVWDSLFMDRFERTGDERVALLLHYLPSLDPRLASGARRMREAVEDRAMAQADFAIATGRCVADTVSIRWPGKPVFVCEPGISECFLRQRPGLADASVKLLTVANLWPSKGHVELLEALLPLRDRPWHWHIAGDSGVSPETTSLLRERAASAGVTERVTFHGTLSQEVVAGLMAASDVLACPSTFEAYGMCVAEAVASGLPVVSNRVGAAAQLISHGVTGFLIEPGHWDDFGRHLALLMENRTLLAAFRHNLRHATVRRWEQTCADFAAACDRMCR